MIMVQRRINSSYHRRKFLSTAILLFTIITVFSSFADGKAYGVQSSACWKDSNRISQSRCLRFRTTSNVQCSQLRAGSSLSTSTTTKLSYYFRVALAGGLAGATGTTMLYPMDCAKTLRQSNPTQFESVRQALIHLVRIPSGWTLSKAYRGCIPAALGAIPSSALYFGAYESSKRVLEQRFGTTESKWWIHGMAAATGNMISSAIFVPKEVLKQQLQYSSSSGSFQKVLWSILREKGLSGLYIGYQATLMRNIPSAMIRFMLYEELKQRWTISKPATETSGFLYSLKEAIPDAVGVFGAGAIAGAIASGAMTPIDVIKTRLATGTCPVGVQNCCKHVVKEMGWKGLYAGAGSRMMWSGAFSAIGFGSFELIKDLLGVSNLTTE